MTTLTPTAAPGGSLDLSRTRRIPFARLVALELRKMVDTRAGFWLVLSAALVTLAAVAIALVVAATNDAQLTMANFMLVMNTTMGIFLPVLGIMAVTAEFSQRTALVTFTLVPSRLALIAAKFVAACLVAVIAVAVGVGFSALANVLMGALAGQPAQWDLGTMEIFGYFLANLFGMATGFAFGTLFLSTPVAIVLYFVYTTVLPSIFAVAGIFLAWFAKLQPWIDFSRAQMPLLSGEMTGKDWGYLATSGALWLLLPVAIGLWRVLRAEVK